MKLFAQAAFWKLRDVPLDVGCTLFTQFLSEAPRKLWVLFHSYSSTYMDEQAGYGQNWLSISGATFSQCWTEIPDLMKIIEHCHILVTEFVNTIWSCGGKEEEWCWWWCFLGSEAQSKLCTTSSHRVTVLLWEWSKKPAAIISISWGLFFRKKVNLFYIDITTECFIFALGKTVFDLPK